MYSAKFCIDDIVPPFNFDLTVKFYNFYPWEYKDHLCTRVEKLSSGNVVKIYLSSNSDVNKPKLDVLVKSRERLTPTDKEEVIEKINWCLGLKEDLNEFYNLAKHDRIMNLAIKDLYGLKTRAFPTVFEALVEVICAQNVPLARVYQMMKLLCQELGEPVMFNRNIDYTFPSPDAFLKASPEKLRACKVGYRSKYLWDLASEIVLKNFDPESLKKLSTEEARKKLLSIKGVGSYTAELVLIIGLRRFDAFHLDLWTREVLTLFYFQGKKISDDELREFASQKWGEHKGRALLYLLTDAEKLAQKLNVNFRLKSGAIPP
jgi:3-methyladenine DNA glycosylase/8-oxoguanine DNA glycosylase